MTTVASRKMLLDAIMISRYQCDDTFVAFQPMGILFLEKWGIHFFQKISTAPLFFSVPNPYPIKSSILHWHPVLSRYYLRDQRSSLK